MLLHIYLAQNLHEVAPSDRAGAAGPINRHEAAGRMNRHDADEEVDPVVLAQMQWSQRNGSTVNLHVGNVFEFLEYSS